MDLAIEEINQDDVMVRTGESKNYTETKKENFTSFPYNSDPHGVYHSSRLDAYFWIPLYCQWLETKVMIYACKLLSKELYQVNTPFRKSKCHITLAVLKRGLSCCAVTNFSHGSLNLAFIHLKQHKISIFGKAYHVLLVVTSRCFTLQGWGMFSPLSLGDVFTTLPGRCCHHSPWGMFSPLSLGDVVTTLPGDVFTTLPGDVFTTLPGGCFHHSPAFLPITFEVVQLYT